MWRGEAVTILSVGRVAAHVNGPTLVVNWLVASGLQRWSRSLQFRFISFHTHGGRETKPIAIRGVLKRLARLAGIVNSASVQKLGCYERPYPSKMRPMINAQTAATSITSIWPNVIIVFPGALPGRSCRQMAMGGK